MNANDLLQAFAAVDPGMTAEAEQPVTRKAPVFLYVAASLAAAAAVCTGIFFGMRRIVRQQGITYAPGNSDLLTEAAEMTGTTETTVQPKSITYDEPVSLDSYQVLCASVPAENVVSSIKSDFPQEISGKQVWVLGFLNETTLLVSLSNDDSSEEIGLLPLNEGNIDTTLYQKLTVITENQSVAAWNSDYLIIYSMESDDGWFTLKSRDYCLFDIRNRSFGKPFWSSSKDETGKLAGDGSHNAPLIFENTVYFDDYSMKDGELTATLCTYDIAQKKITHTYPECQKPMLMNGTVLAMTRNQDGNYRKVISLEDQGKTFSYECGDNLMSLEAGYSDLYAITDEGRDKKTGLSVTKLQNLTTGTGIAVGNTVFSDLRTGDAFAVWSNYTGNTTVKPAVYDLKSKQLLTVGKPEELPADVQFFGYTTGSTALLLVMNADRSVTQCYLLQP